MNRELLESGLIYNTLLFSENYQDGHANISHENSNKSTNRRWQDKLDAGTLSSENCRVSEERLSRIANWHHLPRYINLMF